MMPPKILKIDYQRSAKYVVADELQGGMGTVYKLFPVASGSPTVAMKTIRGDSSVKAFDIECEAWFSVAHHPNIARPLAFGTWESLPSVMIEWYPKSLGDLSLATLVVGDIQRLIAETVAPLRFAYDEKALIHQDIKPANILIDGSGKVRLSDFGLARCLVPNSNVRIQMGIGGVPVSTSKELSGTPFFMAPELWSGAIPSVRTDIFSLGVTFYQCLTNEHPYIEGDAAKGTSRVLRLEKLLASLISKGDEGDQIVGFLKKCLALDPSQRYQTYEEMLSEFPWLTPSNGTKNWTFERSEIVAGTAQFFRTKGETDKAAAVLERVLDKRPNDVVIIEEMAKLHGAIGHSDEAELHFAIAYNHLKSSHGIYERRFFPRPALAWARCRILSGYFEEAANVVKDVLAWAHDIPDKSPDTQLIGSGLHSEIGWYLLYQGEFSKAVHELLMCASRYSLDKIDSIWAVEAAWLGGAIKAQADELTLEALENQPDVTQSPGEVEFVWARMVLREYANTLLRGELWKSNPSYIFAESQKLEIEAGMPPGSLLMPKELDKQKVLVSAMDKYSTGGIHHGLIRSLSKI
jgi:serine/threonine protein kinase